MILFILLKLSSLGELAIVRENDTHNHTEYPQRTGKYFHNENFHIKRGILSICKNTATSSNPHCHSTLFISLYRSTLPFPHARTRLRYLSIRLLILIQRQRMQQNRVKLHSSAHPQAAEARVDSST